MAIGQLVCVPLIGRLFGRGETIPGYGLMAEPFTYIGKIDGC